MKPSDISYIEQRLAERPFRFEELYFEILDHVLCKYEDSGSEDVEVFWEKEKLNWSRWKIYMLRVKFHNLMIWQFLKTYINSLFSLQFQDLKINLLFLVTAVILGFNFHQHESIITGAIICLWMIFPVSFQVWIHGKGETLGEKSKISKNKKYVSAKRDALWSVLLANIFFWQIVFTEGGKYLALEAFFGLAFYHPAVTASILFLMLMSVRAFYQVYKSQLKPFLYAVK